jgi:uncharacterized protein YndB with AHSA1/START domain
LTIATISAGVMIEQLPDGLKVVRRVRATRRDAFDAWVNPERLRAWFGPLGSTVLAIDGELGVGLEYRLRIRRDDGHIDQLVWSFREIVPPERLVFGWSVGAEPSVGGPQTVVAISFRDAGQFTEIELEHTGVQSAQQREMFAAGWEGCFAGLEAILHHTV